MKSGFRSADEARPAEENPPSFFQIEGLRESSLVMVEVEPRKDSMHTSNVYVLEVPAVNKIWIWAGKGSSSVEERKAESVARSIKEARGRDAEIVRIREDDVEQDKEFWSYIPGEFKILGFALWKYEIASGEAEPGIFDPLRNSWRRFRDRPTSKAFEKRLYRLDIDGEGHASLTLVSRGRKNNLIPYTALESDAVFILDDGFKVWGWVGDQASREAKTRVFAAVGDYLEYYRRPHLPVSRIKEATEPASFTEHFAEPEARCLGIATPRGSDTRAFRESSVGARE